MSMHILEKRHQPTTIEETVTTIQALGRISNRFKRPQAASSRIQEAFDVSKFSSSKTFDLSPIPSQKDESTYELFSKPRYS